MTDIQGLAILLISQIVIVAVWVVMTLSDLRQAQRSMASRLSGLEEEKIRMARLNFAGIDSLCTTAYEWDGHRRAREMMDRTARDIIAPFRPVGCSVPALDDFFTRFSIEVFPPGMVSTFTPSEIMLARYLCAGFSTKSLCYLLGISEDALYVRKSRLRSKIIRTLPMGRFPAVLSRLSLLPPGKTLSGCLPAASHDA